MLTDKMMTKQTIIEKINDFLIEDFEVEEEALEPNANLKDTIGLDSLDFVDLVVAVESNFGVKLVGEDFVNVVTLQDFYNLIERKLD
jgi:acyl carrier protein